MSENQQYGQAVAELPIHTVPAAKGQEGIHNAANEVVQSPDKEFKTQGRAIWLGHASFTTSPDGKENWIVYHGMRDPTNGWSARTIRTQKLEWNQDGSPKFPRPGYGPYALPSGQEKVACRLG